MSKPATPAAPPSPHENGTFAADDGLLPADRAVPLLLEAVRDSATRATIAAGLGGLVVIHAVDAVGKWSETRYVFWMYMAAIVGAMTVGAWTIFTRSRTALLAAAGLSLGVLLGYVVDRTVGLPGATDDIGNWTEPLGLASMVVEGLTAAVAVAAYALSGHRSPLAG
ncbi:MAG: hypothetical protein JWO90_453 [Solirubrobacterales bacterium]|nr:hypothetical protein [Solirubrobacterales bacterium]